jgi:glycosyltransferase involved in cell wall biosynthesis
LFRPYACASIVAVRILVASGIFPPDPGGPSTHLAQLIPELAARGHRVYALAFGRGTPGPDGCTLTRIPLDEALPGRALRFAREYRRLAVEADVVYAATMGLPRTPRNRPVVLRVPGDPAWDRAVNRRLVPPAQDIDAFQSMRSAPRVACMKLMRALEARLASRVIVPSQYLRRMIEGWGVAPDRITVIPSSVAETVARADDRATARRALGWSPAGRYVLTAARLTAWKGVDYLIDAVARVPGISLVVAGDGPERDALAARAASSAASVAFTGPLSREALGVHMRAADFVALYSGYEGFPHVLLEALRGGTPVIASDRGGNGEIVRDGWNGLLVRHPDAAALEAAVRRAFDGDTHARLAANARSGTEHFLSSTLMPRVAEAIERAAGPSETVYPACAS